MKKQKNNSHRADKFQHKKSLGQHFLNDLACANQIVESLQTTDKPVLEVGPGLGVLTQFLYPKFLEKLYCVDVDDRLAVLIPQKFPKLNFIHQDVLKLDLEKEFAGELVVIGNFPYNISTEIIFKVIDNRTLVTEVVGMFQKEVGQRFAAKHGNKTYGVTSVITQAYYDVEYLFDVLPHQFDPPPKVMSGVIRLTRKAIPLTINNDDFFRKAVKAGFSQRRKTLRNALKSLANLATDKVPVAWLDKRAEQLSVAEWIELANTVG